MNRQFIEEVLTKLNTDLGVYFKKIGIFNNDFDKQEEGKGVAINFPALFVSFPDNVEYKQNSSSSQRTENFTVRLYIAIKLVTDKTILDIFDLKQVVFSKMNGFKPTNSSSFVRKAEFVDEDRKGYYVFMQDYETNLIDMLTYIENRRLIVNLEGIDVNGTYDN